jgi:hypothetical protein
MMRERFALAGELMRIRMLIAPFPIVMLLSFAGLLPIVILLVMLLLPFLPMRLFLITPMMLIMVGVILSAHERNRHHQADTYYQNTYQT